MTAVKLLAKIRETGRSGDYAAARKLMKRHATVLSQWRMQKEWSDGYREVIKNGTKWQRELANGEG